HLQFTAGVHPMNALPGGLGTLTVTTSSASVAAGTVNAKEQVTGVSLLPEIGAHRAKLCLPLVGCVPSLVGYPATGLIGSATASVTGLANHTLDGQLDPLASAAAAGSAGSADPAGEQVNDLLDIGLAQSEASATAGATPPANTGSPESAATSAIAQVSSISLLGDAVPIPINPAPDTQVNLGLLDMTLNQRSYDPATNTASSQAVIIYFPADGPLASLITGTITIAGTMASATGVSASAR
ncbi:MAG: hypothetical protein ACRDX8_06635, partial [Acidimicrobiales bacterium]